MKIKLTKIYTCSKCGAQSPKWQGRCLECGAWGTLNEEIKEADKLEIKASPDKLLTLDKVESKNGPRIKSGNEEIDRVLGGGIVKGSLILLGGDPGVGKSTLALQVLNKIENNIYASGEESAEQVKIRAERLGLDLTKINFLPQTNLEKIIATAKESRPELIIIDSIQTIGSSEIDSASGSINQITACTVKLMALAKENNISIIIVGHVTKDGMVAGPKTLEHLVDAVLYLENDNQNFYKILRSVKNRFGSTGEIGVFEMTTDGLREVNNPSEAFFDSSTDNLPGNIATAIIEGSRPFLIEIQSLTNKTSFGYPQRKTAGFDLNRLQMIIAVLSKTVKNNLGASDIYLNVTSGLKIKESSADLAAALAIYSANENINPKEKTFAVGEIGLSGEIRNVPMIDKIIAEAEKMGFKRIIIPEAKNIKDLKNGLIIKARTLKEATDKLII